MTLRPVSLAWAWLLLAGCQAPAPGSPGVFSRDRYLAQLCVPSAAPRPDGQVVNPASASPIAWQRKGSAANGMAVYEALAGGPQFTRLAIARVGGTTQFAWELGRFATLAPGQWSAWTSADFTSDDPGFVWGVLNTEPYQRGEASPRHGPKLRVQVGRPEIGVPAATPDEALPGC